MDKFFNSTFDALTNVIPGSCVIAIAFLFDADITSTGDLLAKLNKIELGSAAFLVFLSYVIGFAMTPVGKFLYTFLGTKIWSLNLDPVHSKLTITEKFVLVRQFSPSNFKYIESWNMFCNLAHSLAVASLLLLVASLYRLFLLQSHTSVFITLAILSTGLFFIFLHRAVIFRRWAMNDLNATVDKLAHPEWSRQ